MSEEKKIREVWYKKTYYGMPVWLLAMVLIIIYAAVFTGILPDDDMLSTITIMYAIGFVLFEIGERLPIWKDYIGGGAVMAFFGAACLEYFKILPEKYAEAITFFYDDFGFQTVFISLLIVSAVLTVNRRQLVKAFSGYIPAILGGIFMAGVFGVAGDSFYSTAFAILNIANNFAILGAVALNALGKASFQFLYKASDVHVYVRYWHCVYRSG